MDRLAKLVIAAAALCAGSAHAGYAQLASPAGWSAGTAEFGNTYRAAANGSWMNGVSRASTVINAGGKAVTMPAALRMSANAPRFVASRIGVALAGGPASLLVGGLTVGAALALPYVAEWWKDTPYEWTGEGWIKKVKILNGYWKPLYGNGQYSSPTEACNATHPGSTGVIIPESPNLANCMMGGGVLGTINMVGNEAIQVTPVEYDGEVKPALQGIPLPSKLPDAIPLELPVDLPIINPSPALEPQPLFVPTGNPVQNPSFDPDKAVSPQNQPYVQPGIRVIPAPTQSNPWQVDVQPVDRPVASPNPNPEPSMEGDPNTEDKPKEDQRDLCEKNPDILACAKLDTPDDQDIPASEKPISITPDSGWGPDGGTCPAPKVIMTQGRSIPIPFDLFCTYMQGMRPIIIAMAWLSAAFILIGAREGN